MHMMGRRWGGGVTESSFTSSSVFASDGCAHGDREALLRTMPEEHKTFLESLEFVFEMPGMCHALMCCIRTYCRHQAMCLCMLAC